MSQLRSRLLAVGVAAAGIVTLRAIRKRRTTPRDEAEAAAEAALEEVNEAVDHGTAAAGHARVAGEKAIEYAREEFDAVPDRVRVETESESPVEKPARRIREAGKGLIRR